MNQTQIHIVINGATGGIIGPVRACFDGTDTRAQQIRQKASKTRFRTVHQIPVAEGEIYDRDGGHIECALRVRDALGANTGGQDMLKDILVGRQAGHSQRSHADLPDSALSHNAQRTPAASFHRQEYHEQFL